jgi:hypothetical protein
VIRRRAPAGRAPWFPGRRGGRTAADGMRRATGIRPRGRCLKRFFRKGFPERLPRCRVAPYVVVASLIGGDFLGHRRAIRGTKSSGRATFLGTEEVYRR